MKLCLVGKYPPIVGGVSASTYWENIALRRAGDQTLVVTNAGEVEPAYRIRHDVYRRPDPLDDADVVKTSAFPLAGPPIPSHNPFVTKLAGLVAEHATAMGADGIYAHYAEPYGIAANLASQWTGLPYIFRHAGSDVGLLFKHAGIAEAYRRLFLGAAACIVSSTTYRGFINLGVPPDRLRFVTGQPLVPGIFTTGGPQLSVRDVLTRCRGEFAATLHALFTRPQYDEFDPSLPTIGCYGKLGLKKGTVQLIKAFEMATNKGLRANLVYATGAHPRQLDSLLRIVNESSASANIYFVPWMPHDVIPEFIRSCTLMAFLENDFPISIHRPRIPEEVVACGRTLLLSRQVAGYQRWDTERLEELSFLVDPQRVDELSESLLDALHNPESTERRGEQAAKELAGPDSPNWSEYAERLSGEMRLMLHSGQEKESPMALSELQQVVARAGVSTAFRRWLDAAPEQALAGYELSDAEMKAVIGQKLAFFEEHAAGLRAKRLKQLRRAFPLTSAVDAAMFDRLAGRYVELSPEWPAEGGPEDVERLARYIRESNDSAVERDAYISAIVDFEWRLHRVSTATDDRDRLGSIGPFVDTAQTPSADLDISGNVVYADGLSEVVSYRFRVHETRPEPFTEVPEAKPVTIAIIPAADRPRPIVFVVNDLVETVFALARRPMIVSRLAATVRSIEPEYSEDTILLAITQCVERGLLRRVAS